MCCSDKAGILYICGAKPLAGPLWNFNHVKVIGFVVNGGWRKKLQNSFSKVTTPLALGPMKQLEMFVLRLDQWSWSEDVEVLHETSRFLDLKIIIDAKMLNWSPFLLRLLVMNKSQKDDRDDQCFFNWHNYKSLATTLKQLVEYASTLWHMTRVKKA